MLSDNFMQLKLKKLNARLQFGLLSSCCKRRFELKNFSAICFDILFVWFTGQKECIVIFSLVLFRRSFGNL